MRLKLRLRLVDVPHLQKQQQKAHRGAAAQHDRRVLPVAEAFHAVDILVREVHAAGEGDLPVYDEDLAVVAVIVVRGDERHDRRELLCLDAVLLQAIAVVRGKLRHLAHAVVHDAHVHALGGLFDENVENAPPHIALLDDEIFEEDEGLRLAQSLQHCLKFLLAGGEVGHVRVVIDREAAAAVEVFRQIVHARAAELQPVIHRRILRQGVRRLLHEGVHAPAARAVAEVHLREEQERRARQGQDRDEKHPRELCRGVHLVVEEIDDHHEREQPLHHGQLRHILQQPVERAEEDRDLKDQQQRDHEEPAEHEVQQALLHGLGKSGDDFVVVHLSGLSLRLSPRW